MLNLTETPNRRAEGAWYVVETKRHAEALCERTLAEAGLETYLPRIERWPRPAVGAAVGPMFPRYLFAKLRIPEDYHRVIWRSGVKALVTFGSEPAELPAPILAGLREREDANGIVRCEQKVEAVRVSRGPLRGMVGLVDKRISSRDRVVLLLDILQRETRVEIPQNWVACE